MAYNTDNLSLVYETVGGGYRKFVYVDVANESNTTLVGAGFFSDGVTHGMRKGDMVDVVQPSAPKFKQYHVASASGAAVTIAAVTAIT